MSDYYDILIVGAGFSGCVLAERIAKILNKKILIIDKRNHIGGNCYDYIESKTGIRISKYGAHIFHTNNDIVWEYLQQFSKWIPWEHKVLAKVNNKLIHIPVNITTINIIFNKSIETEEEMKSFLDTIQIKYDNPKNSEEVSLSKVGKELYELIFKNYTKKQWNKYPNELDASVLSRIPIRYNFDNRYFTDKYQALPKDGYTKIFENMLNHYNITVMLNTDYFDIKNKIKFNTLFFTGPIDIYFNYLGMEKLEYRSINFIHEIKENCDYYQENSVVNYPQNDVSFTRIVEYKHFLNQQSPHTIIVKEITTDNGEPYYPVPNERNRILYNKYKKYIDNEQDLYFVGRLATYKYYNMDEVIDASLNIFNIYKNKQNNV